jgi:hypothetical protein
MAIAEWGMSGNHQEGGGIGRASENQRFLTPRSVLLQCESGESDGWQWQYGAGAADFDFSSLA